MTRDSDAAERTDGTRTMRLWAQGVRTTMVGPRELARAGEETMRLATAPYVRRDRTVREVAPHGTLGGETERTAPEATAEADADDAFDAFLAGFEPELPLTG
jgi:phosphohistidine phosphatase SixA